MLNITLPDGNKLNFKQKVTGIQIAEKISKSLAKEALVMSVNGNLKDLTYEIKKDSSVKIFTSKDNEGLETIKDETTGFLFNAGDTKSLSEKLSHIFDLDRNTLKLMGNAGRENVIKKFNVEKMCFSTYSEYKKLLN